MTSKLIPILIANLFAAGAAAAADGDFAVTGSVGLGLRGVTTPDTKDKAKFNEYRDLKNSGGIGTFDISGSSNRYYLDAFGENLGRDDQYLNFRGGQYGVFKYQLTGDNILHNFAFGARTPYSGLGSSVLSPGPLVASTGAAAVPPGNWNTFDARVKRENLGGSFEFSNNSPWYLRADVSDNKTKGYKLQSVQGTGLLELPEPVAWKTSNVALEGGYASKRGQFNVGYMESKFTNDNDPVLMFRNPATVAGNPGLDTVTLAPDNRMKKWTLNGVLRQLPLGSTLAGRYTNTELANSIGTQGPGLSGMLTNTGTATAPVFAYPGTASPSTFNGNIKTETGSLSLTSSLARQLDSRIYYNHAKRENDSTQMTYRTGAALTPWVDVYDRRSDYKKDNWGVDLTYRINKGNKLTGGFDYLKKETNREDVNSNKDKKYYLEYKNTLLETLSARVKYQRLNRSGGGNLALLTPSHVASDPDLLPHFEGKFDVANLNQGLWKLVLDWTPKDNLDLSFDWINKKNAYRDLVLGRTSDKRNEYILSVSWGDPSALRLTAFADWEESTYDGARRFIPRLGLQNFDVNTPIWNPPGTTNNFSTSSYNWWDKVKDTNYAFGIGADWPVSAKWTLKGSYIYMKTTGAVDFSSVNNVGTPTAVTNSSLAGYDNTKRNAWNLKAQYKHDRNWDFTGGFAYEKYEYSDDAYNGYQYNPVMTGTSSGYLTGIGAFPAYTAKIYYLFANYKF